MSYPANCLLAIKSFIPVSGLLSATAGFDVSFAMAGALLVGVPPVLCAALACLALAWSFIRVSRPTRI